MSISTQAYDSIIREYDERRMNQDIALQSRKHSLYQKFPRFKEIDDQIADLSMEKAMAILATDTDDEEVLSSLHSSIKSLSEEKSKLLLENGYPSDYLMPKYLCPDCKDTGYIDHQRCHCLKQAIINVLYKQSQIDSILLKENFAMFTDKYYNESEKGPMMKIYDEAKAFVSSFDDSHHNLLFWGDVGCGKTFLSNCIAKELLDSGHSVIYFTSYKLFNALAKNTFEHGNIPLGDIYDCDLLVIDDLGSEMPNSFTSSQLFTILNERLQRDKSTIISTNLKPKQLTDLYSERSISRIFGNYNLYQFTGGDIRQRKKYTS